MNLNEDKIEALWRWFYSNEKRIREAIENESPAEQRDISEHLDNLVLDIGLFSWEISPGINKDWALTISPNGDKDLLILSKEIIQEAPELIDWEFNYCKLAKDWNRTLVLYDNNMDEKEIDASKWKYVALVQKNGKIELVLEAGNISHLDDDTATTAANLVVQNEIGEEARINKIASINIVDQLGDEYVSQKLEISQLKTLL